MSIPLDPHPSDFDSWPASAQQAYLAMLDRAVRAESVLDDVKEQVLSNYDRFDASPPPTDKTVQWQGLVLATLNKLAQDALLTLDVKPILETIVRLIGQVVTCTSAYICEWNPTQSTMTVSVDYMNPQANDAEKQSDVGSISIIEDSFRQMFTESAFWVSHADDTNISVHERAVFNRYGLKSVLYVPLRTDTEIVGHIELWETRQRREFTQKQIDFVTAIARQCAGAVRNTQLHHALQESESRYRQLVKTMSEGLVQTDVTGRIQFANDRFCEMMGTSQEAIVGQTLTTIWQEHVIETTEITSETRWHTTFESRIRTPYGEELWVQVSSVPLRDMHNHLTGQVAVYTDITKRRLSEIQELELRLEKERMRILTRFIQDASHEFYTPLSIIRTHLYLLKRRYGEHIPTHYLETMQAQTEGIQRLIWALVTMTALDATTELHTTSHNLNDLLNYTIHKYDSVIQQKQIKIEYRLVPDELLVEADGEKLLLALDAILENAIRYTPEEGSIIVETAHDDRSAALAIYDTGKGMPPAVIDRIFERFYREDEAHSTRGFGLGLAIAQRVIDMHRGTITVESEPNKGSVFHVVLPLFINETIEDEEAFL